MNMGTAYFLDGHKEIITEYNILDNGHIYFKTESGEYLHTSKKKQYRPGEIVSRCCGFYKNEEVGYSVVDIDRVVLKVEEVPKQRKFVKGEEHPKHKLTECQVEYIRRVYDKKNPKYTAAALAEKFGVHKNTIHAILRGETWR